MAYDFLEGILDSLIGVEYQLAFIVESVFKSTVLFIVW